VCQGGPDPISGRIVGDFVACRLVKVNNLGCVRRPFREQSVRTFGMLVAAWETFLYIRACESGKGYPGTDSVSVPRKSFGWRNSDQHVPSILVIISQGCGSTKVYK
jgi:hypothetical protein